MTHYLDFETALAELEGKIAELRTLDAGDNSVAIGEEIKALEKKAAKQLADIYAKLDPWQKAMVARNPERPHALDYIGQLITEFTSLAGQEKGNDTTSRLKHNFGMARPEGYRKAVRLMELADRFGLPVITFVDTAGAYPGIDAEERGQAEAIARSTDCGLALGVPSVAVVIGEGGSGGAIAIATANVVLMLEHAIYSVISPEGAASILWRDAARAQDAAAAMKITAQDLKRLGVIDEIVPEPKGGANRGPREAIASTGEAIARALRSLDGMTPDGLRKMRREKFLAIGRSL